MERDERRAWRRVYDKTWVAGKRDRCFKYLGGRCRRCGTTEQLQFDHIDPKSLSFRISGNLNRRWEVLVVELDKCQLLCLPCHRRKSKENGETGGGQNKFLTCPHGTLSGYGAPWKCRCDDCRRVKSDYVRKYRKTNGLMKRLTKQTVLEIRSLFARGTPYLELAEKFNVDRTTVWKICTRRTWKHLE